MNTGISIITVDALYVDDAEITGFARGLGGIFNGVRIFIRRSRFRDDNTGVGFGSPGNAQGIVNPVISSTTITRNGVGLKVFHTAVRS